MDRSRARAMPWAGNGFVWFLKEGGGGAEGPEHTKYEYGTIDEKD